LQLDKLDWLAGPQIHEEHRKWGVAIRCDYSGIFPCEHALWILNPKSLTPFLSKNIIPFLGFGSSARKP